MTFSNFSRLVAANALIGLSLMSAITSAPAAEWRSQREALQAGQVAVEQARQQHFDMAFEQAERLVRSDDAATRERLLSQKQNALDAAARLGDVRSLSVPDETFFAGCITRSYLVRHSGGQQRWLLKFRRGHQGWYLSDLDVRAS